MKLDELLGKVEQTTAEYVAANHARDEAVVAAARAGATVLQIAQAGKLTPQRVSELLGA